ncbi:MAG TPA: nicotinate-nucleotide adenylyltransferase [Gemmatimonadaceae bacterium]
MRIGLLGGSFDPPHTGHLLAASDAFDALSLDRVVLIPTGTQPLKAGHQVTAAEHRFAMTKQLVGDDARFTVDPIEIERGGLSYTVDTLAALADRWPGAELFWLVGTDVTATFAKWREPARIGELATVVVLQRTGEDPNLASLPATTRVLKTRRIDVSSTEVRQRISEGKSIRGFVPEAVAEFIAAERLYR